MDRKNQKNIKADNDRRHLPTDTKNLSELMEFDFDDILAEEGPREKIKKSEAVPLKGKRNRWIYFTWIKEAVLIVIILWIMTAFIGQIEKVRNDSMAPTLSQGERVIVNKIIYRLKEPAREDIIVYKAENGEKLLGRIIGLPGDTIQIDSNGSISVNGNRYQGSRTVYLIGQVTYPLVVKEGCYFILCENGKEGKDSRYQEIGTVERDAIRGKVLCRIWPVSSWGVVK